MPSVAPYSLLPTSPTRGQPHDGPLLASYTSYQNQKTSEKSNHTNPALTSMNRRGSSLTQNLVATTTAARRIPLLAIAFSLAACFALGIIFTNQKWLAAAGSLSSSSSYYRHDEQTATTSQLDARGRPVVDFEPYPVPPEWACNPFKQPGKLMVNLDNAGENYWKPYEQECKPSTMLKDLHYAAVDRIRAEKAAEKTPEKHRVKGGSRKSDLAHPWLMNQTIVLQGDSMERLHLNDFCHFVGGNLTNINPWHPASPPVYRKPMPTILGSDGKETPESLQAKEQRRNAEDSWTGRPDSWYFTRPWVCDIPEYGATVVNVFAWGMADMEAIFHPEDFYHGPSTWIQRFEHILLPLLKNLAEHYQRPQILKPTLIELASGFWDLRGWTELDFIAAGLQKPYPKDSDIPFTNNLEERDGKWVSEATEAIKRVARAFPGEDGNVRNGPIISWRTMHNPKKNNFTPYNRNAGLDSLSRKLIHDLRVESLSTSPTARASEKPKQRGPLYDDTDYGFDERLRLNEVGGLLIGQHQHFKDFLHPNPIPGNYLWGDTILYELKRALERVGRSSPR